MSLPVTLEINFVPFKSLYGYTENGQAVEVRYAFVNKVGNTYTEMFLPVMCRDYLNDILHAEFWGSPSFHIYGFTYDSSKQHIDRDRLRLSLHNVSESAFVAMEQNILKMLHPIEDRSGFIRSVLLKPNEKTLIIEGDPKWLCSTYLISLYTFVIRMSGLQSIKEPLNWLAECTTNIKQRKNGWEMYYEYFRKPYFEKSLFKLGNIVEFMSKHPDMAPSGIFAIDSIENVHGYTGIYNAGYGKSQGLLKLVQEVLLP